MSSTTMVADKHRLIAEPSPASGEITLVSGPEVLQTISDTAFIRQWDELYALCPWATIFQSSNFVTCWYKHYATTYAPILVLSRQNGKLTGLLAMADNIPELGIAGAGGYDAYYHLWLSYPESNDRFITEAIQKIRSVYPGKDVCLKYITPNTPVSWITENDALKRNCVVRRFSRPILDINQVEEATVLSRKQFREKHNRLKRLGAVTFDVLTDAAEFETALEGLVDYYDFRKAATYAITPFREDPSKKGFLIDMVKRGLLFAAALRVNNQVCAMVTATTPSKGWVHGAGIVVHNLKFSRVTPGYIIMKLFSVWLKKYPHILYDVTPGDHAYKDQHANGYDELLELRVTGPVRALAIGTLYEAKAVAKKLLSERQIKPAHVKAQLIQSLQKLKRPSYLLAYLTHAAKPKTLTAWRLLGTGAHDAPDIRFKQDSIAELLLYNEAGGRIPSRLFMSSALKLYESGQALYTYAPHNSLRCLVWVSASADLFRSTLLQEQGIHIPDDSVLLHGWDTFGLQAEESARLLHAVSRQLQAAYPSSELYLVANGPSGNFGNLVQPLNTG